MTLAREGAEAIGLDVDDRVAQPGHGPRMQAPAPGLRLRASVPALPGHPVLGMEGGASPSIADAQADAPRGRETRRTACRGVREQQRCGVRWRCRLRRSIRAWLPAGEEDGHHAQKHSHGPSPGRLHEEQSGIPLQRKPVRGPLATRTRRREPPDRSSASSSRHGSRRGWRSPRTNAAETSPRR